MQDITERKQTEETIRAYLEHHRDHVMQVLGNLLVNAYQAMPGGGEQPCGVKVRCAAKKQGLPSA